MKIIDFKAITGLHISPALCLEWAGHMMMKKYECDLPPKISLKMPQDIFITTMPSEIPELGRCGVKVVSRYPQKMPALQSEILLYDSKSGERLALMDGTWITAMRTGAIAALSIQKLQSSKTGHYAFMGLGNTARATLICLADLMKGKMLDIRLLAYKGQENDFMERFKDYTNLQFSVYQDVESLITGADVVVSCVTVADHLLAPDHCYKPGVLVVPVHTRGFQNCDLFFDKVFADDTGHVKGFKYFSQFRQFDELPRVMLGQAAGRESDEERILVYNMGISIHDIYFASQIYDQVSGVKEQPDLFVETRKFWV